jgi:hypothetical protein
MGVANPENKYEIRSFLGLCTHYKWFTYSFAHTVKLVTELTEKKQALQWMPEVEAAFQTLKEALCTAPILAYPQPRERFITETDVHNVGIGEPLYQV